MALVACGVACGSKANGTQRSGGIVLPFIENDFSRALDKARESNLPLFVEVWAPW